MSETKICPFCAEEIKSAAVVCKHCGRELPTEPEEERAVGFGKLAAGPWNLPLVVQVLSLLILVFVLVFLVRLTVSQDQSPAQPAALPIATSQLASAAEAAPSPTATVAPPTSPTPPLTPASEGPPCPEGCLTQFEGCDIKGNISFESGEKIYHVPGQEYYEDTIINPDKGERWFCSEEDAIRNGFRKAYQ